MRVTDKIRVMDRYIWVTGQFSSIHRWADCSIEEVSFLKNWHRHLFKVKVGLRVDHDDRDLEFFVVQTALKKILRAYEDKNHDMSCEMFGEEIGKKLSRAIKSTAIKYVQVSEDGENGAIVFFEDQYPGKPWK